MNRLLTLGSNSYEKKRKMSSERQVGTTLDTINETQARDAEGNLQLNFGTNDVTPRKSRLVMQRPVMYAICVNR